jgi:hypothetical protein
MSISRSLTILGCTALLAGTMLSPSVAHAGVVTGSIDGIFTTGGTSNLDTNGYFGAVNSSLLGEAVHVEFQYTAPFSEAPINPVFGFGSSSVTVAVTVNGITVSNTGTSNLVETQAAALGVQINSGLLNVAFSTSTPYVYGNLQTQAGMDSYLGGSTGYGQVFLNGEYINYTITGHSDPVPEPMTIGLLGVGASAIGLVRRRRTNPR